MYGGYSICMEMFLSGVLIGMPNIQVEQLLTIKARRKELISHTEEEAGVIHQWKADVQLGAV